MAREKRREKTSDVVLNGFFIPARAEKGETVKRQEKTLLQVDQRGIVGEDRRREKRGGEKEGEKEKKNEKQNGKTAVTMMGQDRRKMGKQKGKHTILTNRAGRCRFVMRSLHPLCIRRIDMQMNANKALANNGRKLPNPGSSSSG